MLGGTVLFVAVSLVSVPGHTRPAPSDYLPLGFVCFGEGVTAIGLGWYVARIRRIPAVLRLVPITLLGMFVVGVVAVGVNYLLGSPP